MKGGSAQGKAQWVSGIHAVRTALKHGAGRVQEILVDAKRNDRRLKPLLDEARKLGLSITESDRKNLDRLSAGASHQGVVARTEAPSALNEADLDELMVGLDKTSVPDSGEWRIWACFIQTPSATRPAPGWMASRSTG